MKRLSKKINFAIIGPATKNTSDLVREIKKRNFLVSVMRLDEIYFEISDHKFIAEWKNKNLDNFDIFIFRAYNKNPIEAQILAKKLLENNKIIIDDALGKEFIPSKIFEAKNLIKNKINYLKTFQAISFSSWRAILNKIKFPIIVKPLCGQKGQNMHKFDSRKVAMVFFKKNFKGYLAQEYCPIDGDMRVFVVGNKVLGAIKRFILKGDFRSNASLGAKAEKYIVDKKLKEIALSSARIMGYEIAGVDVLSHEGKYFILEVNHTPQWQKFKEVTGINPAKYIIDYAIQKYEKN